ncbi:MAG: peptidylprolyl isomerase [Methylophilus sp.]
MISNYLTKAFYLVLSLGLLVNSINAMSAQIEKIDRIVAVVDQSVITEQELLDKTKSVVAQIEKKGGELPSEKVLQKQILERLIVDSLQLQLAAQTGIKVDDGQLDKTIERIAEQNKLTVNEFKSAIEKDGISFYKFREDIRNEITISRLREREVDSKVTVSEGEVDNYLTQSNRAGDQDDYEISAILIRTPQDLTPEDIEKARSRTEQVMKSLDSGMSFNEASATYSDAPNALEGGSMGWRNASQIPPAFLELLKTMKSGETSKPFRTPNGIYILKLNDRRTGTANLMVDQTHVRHILIKLSEVVSESEAKHKIDVIRERIVNGTAFEEMARQYSEDGSASNGGDLGWVNPGDTVPAFEREMSTLEPNQVSQPVKTPFGWHIIQVLERRKEDMTQQATRLKARQEIRARKAEEAYNDWIREMRDRAYVDLRLEDKF